MRYTSRDEEPVRYRFLCLSRNLTYDRSWDTALVFDGVLAERENAFSLTHPVGNFIASLPGMVVEGLSDDFKKKIDKMQDEIRRVDFKPPQGFKIVAFHPMGIDNEKANPLSGRIDRMLVVSPFLTEGYLNRLAYLGKDSVVVSRLDSLKKVSADCLRRFSEIFYLKEDAIPEQDGSDIVSPGSAPTHIEEEKGSEEYAIPKKNGSDFVIHESAPKRIEEEKGSNEENLDGLHVKLYVADAGSEGRIWTGSANATEAAFSKNVEFLVELIGEKKYCGIDAVLNGGKETQDGKETGLRTILDPFSITDGPNTIDELYESLKQLADKSRSALAKANLSARVSQDADEHFSLSIEGSVPDLPEEASIMCRPITLKKARAVNLSSSPGAHTEFRFLLNGEISAFFAFDVTIKLDGKSLVEGFVLKLPLKGAPVDRNERILRDLLKDPSQVIRLMLLLLSLDERSNPGSIIKWGQGPGEGGSWMYRMVPLFECMVRALASDPRRIDDLNNFIQDLKGHSETMNLLPKDLDEIWGPIWEARKMVGGKGYEKV